MFYNESDKNGSEYQYTNETENKVENKGLSEIREKGNVSALFLSHSASKNYHGKDDNGSIDKV